MKRSRQKEQESMEKRRGEDTEKERKLSPTMWWWRRQGQRHYPSCHLNGLRTRQSKQWDELSEWKVGKVVVANIQGRKKAETPKRRVLKGDGGQDLRFRPLGFGISRFRGFGISRFRGFGISRFRGLGLGIPRFTSCAMSGLTCDLF